jgi:peptidoglycan/xylan/chitin deacetylase (PgdA/CDA1 family)
MTAVSPRVPILAYHSISDGPPPLCVPPARFGEHLSSLTDAGWSTLTLDELLAGHARGRWPERRLVLTFDDGLASFASEALPRLQRAGFSALLFVVAGRIGGSADWPGWPRGTPNERLLDAGALADAAAAGVEIGAHSVAHRRLSALSPEVAAREVLDGRRQLEDLLARPVRSFAYPFGDAPPEMASLVRERFRAGFGIRLAYASRGSRAELFERIDAFYLRNRRSLASLADWTTRVGLAVRSLARVGRRAAGYGS